MSTARLAESKHYLGALNELRTERSLSVLPFAKFLCVCVCAKRFAGLQSSSSFDEHLAVKNRGKPFVDQVAIDCFNC